MSSGLLARSDFDLLRLCIPASLLIYREAHH